MFLVFVVFLPSLQSAALNSTGTASLFGFNLAVPIDFFARTSSKAGVTMGWDELANLYTGDIGPVQNDPYYHSAWDYWMAPIIVWGAGSILLVIGLVMLRSFVGHFVFPSAPASAKPTNTAKDYVPDAGGAIGGIWQSIPFMWPSIDSTRLSSAQVDMLSAQRLM